MGKKDRMGKGLDSLFSDNSIEEFDSGEEGAVSSVKISLLEPNKGQPRTKFDEDKLGELADSIRENGVLQPILVRPLDNGGYQIVAGERRWRAARIAGLSEVPVFIKELSDKQTMQMAIIENIQRQDLSPLEESAAYQSLMDNYGMTQQQVAEAVGKSRSAVANSVRLLSLCDDVKEMVDSGELSAGHAKVLAGLSEPDQIDLAAQVSDMGLTVRQLEMMAAETNKPKSPYNKEEMDKLLKGSVRQSRPFLKEFELAVNTTSNIKVKTHSEKDGGVRLDLKIGKEMDIQAVLSSIAEFLKDY